MSALDQALSGERTKYKAIVKHFQQTMWRGLGKDASEELPEEKVAALANIVKNSQLTPTRNDRRFPNQNQVNNCWTAFNEYQLCVEKRGRQDVLCLQRGRDYSTVCPVKWLEEWKEQTDAGNNMSVGKSFLLSKE